MKDNHVIPMAPRRGNCHTTGDITLASANEHEFMNVIMTRHDGGHRSALSLCMSADEARKLRDALNAIYPATSVYDPQNPKVGDVVQHKNTDDSITLAGLTAPLTVVNAPFGRGVRTISVRDARGRTEVGWYSNRFEAYVYPRTPAPVQPKNTHWIIASLNNLGQPAPAQTPKLMVSEAQAVTVASKMAEQHAGTTFAVYEKIGEARVEPAKASFKRS